MPRAASVEAYPPLSFHIDVQVDVEYEEAVWSGDIQWHVLNDSIFASGYDL
jgi:hypothetical protein